MDLCFTVIVEHKSSLTEGMHEIVLNLRVIIDVNHLYSRMPCL